MEGYKGLREATEAFSAKLAIMHSNAVAAFKQHDLIDMPPNILSQMSALDAVAQKHLALATTQNEALKFNEYEARIIALIEHLSDLREAFFHYDTNSKIVAAFERQILSLGEIFDRFIRVQNTALQAVLDKISNDVGKFYKKLHPNENVDKVRLRIVGEEGIEFEYYFHGKPTHPPMKYLSESHLNSLGVVLFLASARLFNRTSKFLVLDDIVTSFDANHRRRLLRLIKEKFSDWQIILLTHEAFWFDIIKKELAPEGWLIHELVWDDENGIQIEPSAKDLVALIAVKRKKFDVSNDLRKLLEATLKEICFSCEVKMAFRYNDQNERRMSGELLSALRVYDYRRCAELKDSKLFANLEGSNLIATVGSHDNVEKIAGGDIDVALSDIKQLHDLFACSECGRYVEADRQLAGENKITCKCGQKELDWR